jgi:hypothetical protein
MAGLSQPPHGDMPRSGDHVQSVPKWPLALTLVQVTEFSPEVCKIAAPPAVEGLAKAGSVSDAYSSQGACHRPRYAALRLPSGSFACG